ncbi:hypothetical protein HMPREF0322_03287 [Desulfitobacterium hafniense DP7]|uniref:Uncharacterized protein n=1 Tax=Desulfitobacterium hafniense DP7 TaxID=537010 RepID=G9XQN9_DESHA|nr:hypothetical protein HMPREF0322_03287 [Desulfitobacterium hafniense DP7]
MPLFPKKDDKIPLIPDLYLSKSDKRRRERETIPARTASRSALSYLFLIPILQPRT